MTRWDRWSLGSAVHRLGRAHVILLAALVSSACATGSVGPLETAAPSVASTPQPTFQQSAQPMPQPTLEQTAQPTPAPTVVPPTPSPAPQTDVIVYEPFTPAGIATDVTVAGTVAGSCFGESLATSRSDAYRCMAGNTIMDPCFANPYTSGEVACPNSGPSDVTIVDLTEPLPTGSGGQSAQSPWLFKLGNGATCSVATGATATIDGKRINGECSDSSSWVGDIDESHEPWTVLVEPAGSSQLVTVPIADAWE